MIAVPETQTAAQQQADDASPAPENPLAQRASALDQQHAELRARESALSAYEKRLRTYARELASNRTAFEGHWDALAIDIARNNHQVGDFNQAAESINQLREEFQILSRPYPYGTPLTLEAMQLHIRARLYSWVNQTLHRETGCTDFDGEMTDLMNTIRRREGMLSRSVSTPSE